MLAIPTQDKTLKFWISGKVIPKARPRFHNGHAILPCNYRVWKNTAYLEIISQLSKYNIIELPIEKAAVEIQLVGKHRGDGDNIVGSYLDLIVAAEIIKDDRLSCIPEIAFKHIPGDSIGAYIIIIPLD